MLTLLAQVPNIAPRWTDLPLWPEVSRGVGWLLAFCLLLCGGYWAWNAAQLGAARKAGMTDNSATAKVGMRWAVAGAFFIAATWGIINMAVDAGTGAGGTGGDAESDTTAAVSLVLDDLA